MDIIIDMQDVTFRYEPAPGETEKRLLEHFDLQIERGSFVAVLGHNASGKSTVAKLMNGLNKPLAGRVLVNGADTKNESHEIEVRRTVGLVFQNPDNQIVATIVEEDVAFGPENLGVPREEIVERVEESLSAVGMLEYRGHAPHKLSGGQKQRVAIAGIIAMKPDCIVLDEPTAMLDPRGRDEVLHTIHKLNRENGITIVLITHYMDEAAGADRIVVMDDGRILTQGTPRQVFSRVQLLKDHQLDVPQATELVWRLRQEGFRLPECVLDIDECVSALEPLLKSSQGEWHVCS